MNQKPKSKIAIIAGIVMFLFIACGLAYNGGYIVGKLRAHIENNASKK